MNSYVDHQSQADSASEFTLAARLLTSQEQEISWIKRQLHDRLGPLLFAIGVNVKWVGAHRAQDTEVLHARIQETVQLVEQAVQETRRLSSELRSDALNWGSLGLEEALSEYAAVLEEQSQLPILFSSRLSEGETLAPEIASHIYHIAREALANAIRHAGATTITLTLHREGRTLFVSIQDDGKGFDLNKEPPPQALGFKEMRARAQVIGGTLDVHTIPGAAITLRVPIAHEG